MPGMLRLGIALLLAAAAPAFAGGAAPQTTWPMFQYDSGHNAVFDAPNWNVAWRADIGKKSNGGISVVGNTVYIDTFGHKVLAFNALTGAKKWQRKLPNVLMNTPIVVGGIVIVGTGDAKMLTESDTLPIMGRPQGDAIYGLDAVTGAIRWRFDTVGQNMPTGVAVQANNRWQFVFTNGDDHVYGLDAATGRLLWKQNVLGVNGMASLTAYNGIVYGIDTMGDAGYLRLQATDPKAAEAWSHTWAIDPARNGQFVWMAPYGVADASVTIGDGLVFTQGFRLDSPRGAAAAKRAKEIGWGNLLNTEAKLRTVLTAVRAGSGERVWQYVSAPGPNNTLGSAAFTSDAILVDHRLYEPLAFSQQFAAFDSRTGKLLWIRHTDYPVKAAPVLKDGMLFFGDSGSNLYVVRATDGSVAHEYKFPGPPTKWGFAKSHPVIVGRTLFISGDRWLYALRIGDLERGFVSASAAPPRLGPSGDWCPFDPQCTSGSESGAVTIK